MTFFGNTPLGAVPLDNGSCSFLVWAPFADSIDVHVVRPYEVYQRLAAIELGYHYGIVENVPEGSHYFFRLNGDRELPDPVSRAQPYGVHGPSEVVGLRFPWTDHTWRGLSLKDLIIYELHVGTFSHEGSFDGVIRNIPYLKEIGVTAIELMPIAQFPGTRNWGYDGVHPFAVQNSYGGPEGLFRLVNTCHENALAIILDVVYNHLGPEGNYLGHFGPYFTDCYKTSWGPAINFDGPYSDEVRRFFIENTLYWTTDFHIDALRIDAVHCIYDFSANHFLRQLSAEVRTRSDKLSRKIWLIGESDLNDSRVVKSYSVGGHGLDAQWNEDFHHSLHTLLTNERSGYYQDYGRIGHLARAIRDGFVYSGQYSLHRKRCHGNSSRELSFDKFVVFSQNHDQIGNRALGDRLSSMVSYEKLRLAAGLVLLTPSIPLLFMGEEYGETAPFPYFVDFLDCDLLEAVSSGRRKDLTCLWGDTDILDPVDERTFLIARLDEGLRRSEPHRRLLALYRKLISFRKQKNSFAELGKHSFSICYSEKRRFIALFYELDLQDLAMVFYFGTYDQEIRVPLPEAVWTKLIDSEDVSWGGTGSSAPHTINSDGEADLRFHGPGFLVLGRINGPCSFGLSVDL